MQFGHQGINFHANGFFNIDYTFMLQVKELSDYSATLSTWKLFQIIFKVWNNLVIFVTLFIQFSSSTHRMCLKADDCQQKWI